MLLHYHSLASTRAKEIATRFLEVHVVFVTCCPHRSKIQLFQITCNWIYILYKALQLIVQMFTYLLHECRFCHHNTKYKIYPVKAMQLKIFT